MKTAPVLASFVLLAAPAALPAAPLGPVGSLAPALLAAALAAPDDSRDERAVRRAFQDVLDRDPSSSELRRYVDRMQDDGWTEKDVRDDLRERRDSDDRHRSGRSRSDDPDRIVKRAYQDILDREPDSAGLRLYRSRIIDDGWTERDVREALRKSPEYREKNTMTRQKAEEIVRKAYENVLDRAPDAGSRGYVDRVLRDKWTQQDVERELRKSPEYRNKN
jgi:TorA maturation chaperone TorD